MRLLFLAGSGNVSRSLEAFRDGEFNPEIAHLGYSDQLFRVCSELGIPVRALCSHAEVKLVRVGELSVAPYIDPLVGAQGLRYHAAHLAAVRQIAREAADFGASAVIVPTEPYAFLLVPLKLRGLRLIQAAHCTLWPPFKPPGRLRKLMLRLGRSGYRHGFDAVLSASRVVTDQVREVAGGTSCPVVEFMPTFRAEAFEGIPDPDREARPFRVIFAGRVEADKGVFDLLEVARRLRERGRDDIVFDVCGDGGAFPELERRTRDAVLGERFVLHGWCLAPRLKELSARAHAFVVPTTTDFNEGFNQVVVEGLLAKRPVITSKACPALDYVAGGVLQVPPNDVDAYAEAVEKLMDDAGLYAQKQASAESLARRFLDPAEGYASGLRHVLEALQRGEQPRERLLPVR